MKLLIVNGNLFLFHSYSVLQSVLSVNISWPASCSRQTLLQILNSILSYFFRNPVPSVPILPIGSFQLITNTLKYISAIFQKWRIPYPIFLSSQLSLMSFLFKFPQGTTLLSRLLCFFTSNHSSIHRKLSSVSDVSLKLLLWRLVMTSNISWHNPFITISVKLILS